MSYYKKYIKYKTKYLHLKEIRALHGGTETNREIVSLLCTHSARLRCFLTYVAKDIIEELNKKFGVKEIRFKNVSVTKMTITKDGCILNMTFSGFIAEKKRKGVYFTTGKDTDKNFKEGDVIFPTLNFSLDKLNLNKQLIGDKTYVFYIIRHGEGIHNVASTQQKVGAFIKGLIPTVKSEFKDSSLTPKGVEDAKEVGKILFDLLEKKHIDYIFSSKLKRTRETLKYLLEPVPRDQYPFQIIILPCSHELEFRKDGNCDANTPIITNPENMENCYDKIKKTGSDKEDCSSVTISKEKPLLVDWNNFIFYDEKKKKCSDTNMIKEAIEIINKRNKK